MNYVATNNRSGRPEVFSKKGVLRNFPKFTGKHLCQSLFLRPATLLKKKLYDRCFPVNFAKFLRAPFLPEHLWWLLINKVIHKLTKIKLFLFYFLARE